MSNHEHLGASDDQPDQPHIELDPAKLLAEVITAQARTRAQYLPEGAEARLEFLKTIGPLDDLDFAILEALDNRLGPDFPPGLPPKLLQLWQEEDRGGTLPPDEPH